MAVFVNKFPQNVLFLPQIACYNGIDMPPFAAKEV